MRGIWEPIVSTEEFERGLAILARRVEHRVVKRKHDYLLKGLIYIEMPGEEKLYKLTGSTSNTRRSGGGTAYYCVPQSNINLLCREIDLQIPCELMQIQLDPELVAEIRAGYTDEVALKFGHINPNERAEIEARIQSIKDEEARTARLFAAGKISEEVWEGMWTEWLDRRRRSWSSNIDAMDRQYEHHIINLDSALEIIAKVGLLYNGLAERSEGTAAANGRAGCGQPGRKSTIGIARTVRLLTWDCGTDAP